MNAEIPVAVELQRVLPTRGTGMEVLAQGGSLFTRLDFQKTQNFFNSSDTEGELGDSYLRYQSRQLVLLKGKFVRNAKLSQPGISQLWTLQEQKRPVDCLFENLLAQFLQESDACRSLSRAMRPRSSPLTIQLNCNKREPRQSQHLNPRRIMKNTIRIAVALVLIIGTGLVHGVD